MTIASFWLRFERNGRISELETYNVVLTVRIVNILLDLILMSELDTIWNLMQRSMYMDLWKAQ
jgi:hypothetical protein